MNMENGLKNDVLELKKFINMAIKINSKFNADKFNDLGERIKETSAAMCFQIIGEATIRIMNENPLFIEKYDNIPWEKLKKCNNAVFNDYSGLDFNTVFKTIEDDFSSFAECFEDISEIDFDHFIEMQKNHNREKTSIDIEIIMENSIEAINYINNTNEELFSNDLQTQLPVIHNLMVIGLKAAHLEKINPDFVKSINAPWNVIKNMHVHNNLLDEHFNPDPEIIRRLIEKQHSGITEFPEKSY